MTDQYSKLFIVLIFYYMIGFIIGNFIYELFLTTYDYYNKYKEEKNELDRLLIINTIKESLEPYKVLLEQFKSI
ncbi:unknown similar to AMEV169 [Choristoneura rosaceana entomopoxvirus 'L']|uniref:Uncharacterized protein n=1 Tax=Choristoneura rosaceana entomopoxvirus 'L' TaxID=1293539 RepID=A0ABM9QKK0_9POXV|nr:unknown similar to AMEV169 [Choristoneura rosaceana entomopoxvirus 'L']CCU56082.1 unknown similar to AMEV169 [Choristoneura rosaceana entomopoxvirus 'L']